MRSAPRATIAGRLANRIRRFGDDHPSVVALRRDLTTANVADAIDEALNSAFPPSSEQRRALARRLTSPRLATP